MNNLLDYWSLKVICSNCNAILKIDINDLSIFDFENTIFYSFKCCCCNEKSCVYESLIPIIVKKKLLINEIKYLKEVI